MTIDDPILKAHHDGLAFYESQLLQLYREKDRYHPTQYFAMMADPLVEHIRRVRAEIDEYIGLADFERATVHERLRHGAAEEDCNGPGVSPDEVTSSASGPMPQSRA